ncbi:MAG TPA: hypothetical protein VGM31_08640 [Puia sp.]|jgi:uncharacterized membrane protein
MHTPAHRNTFNLGRISYGVAIAAMGLLTMYYRRLPYMMIPPKHHWLSEHVLLIYLFGALLLLAGICIVLERKLRQVCVGLGAVLLSIFIFYFIPYELWVSPNSMHFGDWENAAKELTLASGAWVIAGRRWRAFGVALFALTIISYSFDHFLYAKQAAAYVPAWIPYHLFWLYFTGTALFCSGIAILLNVKRRLAATLLGIMIFSWIVILHIPYALSAPLARNEGEVTSAFLALAYGGIAFMIGETWRNSPPKLSF